jgi:PQQ-dependent dehydrogenase (methanol/ethanol family)
MKSGQVLKVTAMAAVIGAFATTSALAQSDAARIRHCADSDWCSYNRTVDKGWRHSPLAQINKNNVRQLRPAWIFQPGDGAMGLQTTPLAVDGAVYMSSNPSTAWKLDGITGERLWAFVPEMDESVVSRSFFPHSRGLTIGDGRVYMGTLDGRIVALDEDTGEVIWDSQIVDSTKDTVGFSHAGAFVSSDLLVQGQTAGEYPVEGRIFGIDPKTGDVLWTFYTTGRGDDAALATWGGDSWKYGGGGSWQPGTVDYANNQILIGTGNPNPDYDFCGGDCSDVNAKAHRPGINLYTSSTVALDLDTGKLNWYFQEAPSDPYDYDAALGEYLILDDNGRSVVLHPGKNGFTHIHDAKTGQPINIYPDTRNYNWTTGFNLETGQWENMLWPKADEKTLVCPAIDGGHSWNPGSFSPQTGLHYRGVQEWCMWLTIAPEGGADYITAGTGERVTEPFAQAFMAAEWIMTAPPGDTVHSIISARDPVSGDIVWEKRYEIPPHSGLMTTGGGLLFNGTFDGYLEAMDAETGNLLWRFNNGSSHNGGIISYEAGGKQYVAVATGQGSHVGRSILSMKGDEIVNYKESAVLVVFSLP